MNNGNLKNDQMRYVRVRFAPSPTGYLHIGSARTALFNWLFARKNNGIFILRIEDTDEERNKEEYVDCILDGLSWLGLEWDEGPRKDGEFGPYRQSQRKDIYKKFCQQFIEQGDAYFCYCTPEELEKRRKESLEIGGAIKYDGRCRNLTASEKSAFEAEGRKASIRFKMPENDCVVQDIIRGETIFKKDAFGDFVIMKSDGTPTYQLANVVDDALMEVTYVIRGEDLLPSTPRQIAIYKALNKKIPFFAHLPMILAPDRSKLSKRHGAVSITEYQKEGYLPEAVVNYLALLGWSPLDGEEVMSIEKLIDQFSLERINKSGAIFDFVKLKYINSQKIKELPVEKLKILAAPFFEELPNDVVFEKVLSLTKGSVSLLNEFPEKCKNILLEPIYKVEFIKEISSIDSAKNILKKFFELSQNKEKLDEEELRIIFKDLQKETGTKGKYLYLPIRIAVTGEPHGPDMVGTINVIGKEAALKRIKKFLDFVSENI